MAQQTSTRTTLNIVSVIRAALIASSIATVINIMIFFIALSQFRGVTAFGQPLNFLSIIGASFGLIIIGCGIMIGLDIFLDNTIKGWRNLSIIALLISVAFPYLFLQNATLGAIIALEAMQLVAGVIGIYMLTTQVTIDRG